ncbi:MAG: hypothetical protein JWP66_1151 [Naasia sp.]|nr:hypothetical protein [Naasia sp.]
MRFVSAIVAFVIAAGMILYGIAQRTWLAPPDRLTSTVNTDAGAAFTVLDGAVLGSNPGQQRVRVDGEGTVFVAYARTSDIIAWLGDEPYSSLSYDAETQALESRLVEPEPADEAPAETPAGGEIPVEGATPVAESPAAEAPAAEATGPAPAGSDLWLEERTEEGALTWTVSVPDDISLLVASDGTQPAPSEVTVSWPLRHSTPWAGPLIIGGGVLLLVGLALYIWALVHMRRTRGPRRKSPPKLPQAPRPRTPRPPALEPTTTAKGRRATRRMVAVTAGFGVSAALLAGCAPSDVDALFADDPAPLPTVTTSPVPEEEIVPVAVTEGQLDRIVERVSATVTQSDGERNADLLRTRMAGPALEERLANYTMRGADGGIAAPEPIPAATVSLALPQATDEWPRTVLAVVSGEDPAKAPMAVLLRQETPRDNYVVHYSVPLQANVPFPAVAPPTVGSPVLPNDVKLLAMPPADVGAQYADILAQGEASPAFPLFQAEPDGLRTRVGVDYKNTKKANFPSTASLEFSNALGTGATIAMASNDSGAIVVTNILERETARPTAEGATVNLEGQVKALSGLGSTEKGVESTYGFQLLFYVPPSSDETQVVLLGYATSLIGVREL